MAITKIQSGAFPADVITSSAIDDLSITHAKLHTTMDLSSKTVTLPTLSTLNTTGNVGIGVSPSSGIQLKVGNSANNSAVSRVTNGTVSVDLTASSSGKAFLEVGTNHPLVIATNAAERMRIDSSGNVGIGQSVPVNRLHVSGADGYAYLKLTSDSTGHTDADGSRIGLNGSDLRIINAEAASILFQTQNSERMRIDAGGILNVTSGGAPIIPTIKHSGIDPYLAKIRLINRSGQYIDKGGLVELGGITNDEVTRTDVFASVAGLKATTASNNRTGYMQFSVNDGSALTERMRIDSSGNVGIGTSSPNQWASYTDSAATVLQVRNTSQRARIAINGGNGAHLDLVDYAGSANDKHMNIAVNGGILKFGSLNDAGNAWVNDEIMVMDLGLGTVQLGRQPAFVATTTASTDITSQTIIPYNSNLYDRGTNFNTANHRFTAPVTGLYTFTTYHWHKNNTGGRAHLYLYLNGGVNFEFRNTRASSHNEYNRVGFTTTLAMSANDYVYVTGEGTGGGELHTSAGSAYSHFSGYLIG